ncbi:MAG: flagellum-specific ATP synthase FliI, partial [Geobacteraceae bacterium]|nr:flagellum-specific ATP synthase FliI [Geobacteraceae bacterium]
MPEIKLNLKKYHSALESAKPVRLHGKVTQVVGLVIEGYCPETSVGAICEIKPIEGDPIPAEVVGFRNNKTLLMPLGELRGVGLDSLISVRR